MEVKQNTSLLIFWCLLLAMRSSKEVIPIITTQNIFAKFNEQDPKVYRCESRVENQIDIATNTLTWVVVCGADETSRDVVTSIETPGKLAKT